MKLSEFFSLLMNPELVPFDRLRTFVLLQAEKPSTPAQVKDPDASR